MLLITVTAFTVAHSITLSLARLGVVHVPGPLVEATIALSSLLLACEIIRSDRGQRTFFSKASYFAILILSRDEMWRGLLAVVFCIGSPSLSDVGSARSSYRLMKINRKRWAGLTSPISKTATAFICERLNDAS